MFTKYEILDAGIINVINDTFLYMYNLSGEYTVLYSPCIYQEMNRDNISYIYITIKMFSLSEHLD